MPLGRSILLFFPFHIRHKIINGHVLAKTGVPLISVKVSSQLSLDQQPDGNWRLRQSSA
jgi:hypothetical protein